MPSLFGRSPYISRLTDRVVIATQLVGGLVGVTIGYAQFWFLDFWLGAGIATPFGIILGMAWEFRAGDKADVAWHRAWFAVGVLSVVIVAFAFFLIIPMTTTAKTNIRLLSIIPQGSVEQIRLYTPYRSNLLATVDDKKALSGFVTAARDIRLHYPGQLGRNEHVEEWWVVVELIDDQTVELVWTHRSDSPDTVEGMFIETTPRSMTNHGQFISTNLRIWFTEHIQTQLR